MTVATGYFCEIAKLVVTLFVLLNLMRLRDSSGSLTKQIISKAKPRRLHAGGWRPRRCCVLALLIICEPAKARQQAGGLLSGFVSGPDPGLPQILNLKKRKPGEVQTISRTIVKVNNKIVGTSCCLE